MKIIDFHITCTCMRICSKSKTSVTFKPATNKQQAVKWLDWLNCADRYQILDCPIPPLIKHSDYKFDRFQLRVTHNLLYSMGNMDYADSQRQSSISLEVKHPQQTLKITIIFFCYCEPFCELEFSSCVFLWIFDSIYAEPFLLLMNMLKKRWEIPYTIYLWYVENISTILMNDFIYELWTENKGKY